MAINNRQSPAGTIIHSEQVARYTDGRVPDVPRTPTSSPRWGPSASATTTPPSSRSEGGLIWAQRAGGSDVRAVDTASVTPTAVRIRRWVGRATRCRCRRCRPCRQAHVVDDRQIVEVARDHRSGRVADRRLGRNDCRPSCHHVFDTDVVHVLPVRRSGCFGAGGLAAGHDAHGLTLVKAASGGKRVREAFCSQLFSDPGNDVAACPTRRVRPRS